MKYLTLIRHAKAAHDGGVSDIERPLAERGRRDGKAMGAILHDALYLAEREILSDFAASALMEHDEVWIVAHNPGITEAIGMDRRPQPRYHRGDRGALGSAPRERADPQHRPDRRRGSGIRESPGRSRLF